MVLSCSHMAFSNSSKMENKSSWDENETPNSLVQGRCLKMEDWLNIIRNLDPSSIKSLFATCKHLEKIPELALETATLENNSNSVSVNTHAIEAVHQIENSDISLAKPTNTVVQAISPPVVYQAQSDLNTPVQSGSPKTSGFCPDALRSSAFVCIQSVQNLSGSAGIQIANPMDVYNTNGLCTLASAAAAVANTNSETNVSSTMVGAPGKPKFKALNISSPSPSSSSTSSSTTTNVFMKDTRQSPTIGQTPKRLAATAATLAEEAAVQNDGLTTSLIVNRGKRRRLSANYPPGPHSGDSGSGLDDPTDSASAPLDEVDPAQRLPTSIFKREEPVSLAALNRTPAGNHPHHQQQQPTQTSTAVNWHSQCADAQLDDASEKSSETSHGRICKDESMHDEESVRREKRRARNRAAAAKCRQNRQNLILELKTKLEGLKETENNLQQRLIAAESEKAQLEESIRQYMFAGCSTGCSALQSRTFSLKLAPSAASTSTTTVSSKQSVAVLNSAEAKRPIPANTATTTSGIWPSQILNPSRLDETILSEAVSKTSNNGIIVSGMSSTTSPSQFCQFPIGNSLVLSLNSLIQQPCSSTASETTSVRSDVIQAIPISAAAFPENMRPSSLTLRVDPADLQVSGSGLHSPWSSNCANIAAIMTPSGEKWLEKNICAGLRSPQTSRQSGSIALHVADLAITPDSIETGPGTTEKPANNSLQQLVSTNTNGSFLMTPDDSASSKVTTASSS